MGTPHCLWACRGTGRQQLAKPQAEGPVAKVARRAEGAPMAGRRVSGRFRPAPSRPSAGSSQNSAVSGSQRARASIYLIHTCRPKGPNREKREEES